MKRLSVVPSLLLVSSLLAPGVVQSQGFDPSTLGDAPLQAAERLGIAPAAAMQAPRTTRAIVPLDSPGAEPVVRPFGANLFDGGFAGGLSEGLNPDYRLQPGDRVAVRIWGPTQFDRVLPVDPQGNVFVPSVGPIRVGGVAARDLNATVSGAVGRVYTDEVRVYTSLEVSQPVSVFVAGYVVGPGRYAGTPSSSVLHFLDSAGGIEPARGSYRDVRVMRGGTRIATFDLYEFLREGRQPDVQLKDGDTIVVGQRGPTVVVDGDVANPAVFELDDASIGGGELADLAMPASEASHVAVSGLRGGALFSTYVTLERLDTMVLRAGDVLSFRTDRHDRVVVVEVEGSHLGPSRYVVPRDTRLRELLDHIEVNPALADTSAVSLRREDVAQRQKAALNDSLDRLEARYLTASSATDSEASIRAREAELVASFVANARSVEPTGRLVVASDDGVANVMLRTGDTITIPASSESVLLSGEVLVAQAMLHESGMRARDYIERSGGFTERADDDRIVVVHLNGEVTSGANPRVRPGDEIIVLPTVPTKNLQLASTIVDIVYKIALATAVAISL